MFYDFFYLLSLPFPFLFISSSPFISIHFLFYIGLSRKMNQELDLSVTQIDTSFSLPASSPKTVLISKHFDYKLVNRQVFLMFFRHLRSVCMYVCLFVYACMCVYLYMHVCVFTCICMYAEVILNIRSEERDYLLTVYKYFNSEVFF